MHEADWIGRWGGADICIIAIGKGRGAEATGSLVKLAVDDGGVRARLALMRLQHIVVLALQGVVTGSGAL